MHLWRGEETTSRRVIGCKSGDASDRRRTLQMHALRGIWHAGVVIDGDHRRGRRVPASAPADRLGEQRGQAAFPSVRGTRFPTGRVHRLLSSTRSCRSNRLGRNTSRASRRLRLNAAIDRIGLADAPVRPRSSVQSTSSCRRWKATSRSTPRVQLRFPQPAPGTAACAGTQARSGGRIAQMAWRSRGRLRAHPDQPCGHRFSTLPERFQ